MRSFLVKQLSNAHLKGIDLEIFPGEFVGISGPSGSGKSLLLRALADMDAFEGQLALDGQPAHGMPAPQWRRQVALMPATSAWWHDTVGPHFDRFETPQFGALGFPPEVIAWEIRRLSSGERQRLALLRVLAMKPAVLLLDEPTANLDEASTGLAETLIRDYARSQAAAVVWVSHDAAQLRRLCTRVYGMDGGRLIARVDATKGV